MSDPCKFVGVEGEQCDRLTELLEKNPCPSPARARKRAPSVYNLYSRECIKAKGGIKKFGEAGPIMRQCATEYREDKAKGVWRYTFEAPNPDSYGGYRKDGGAPLYKGRNLQKEWKDLHRSLTGGKKK